MSRSLQKAQPRLDCWQWPVTLSAYDRSPHLTLEERMALAKLNETSRFPLCWEQQFGGILHRLLRPLDDVLQVAEAERCQRNGTIILLLREMHHFQTSFWAWSEQEWKEILHESLESFSQQRHGDVLYRAYVIAVSYVLGGFRDLAALGSFSRRWLAHRVFGCEVLDELFDLISHELVKLGYGKKKMRAYLPNLLYEVLLFHRSPILQELSTQALAEMRPRFTHALAKGGEMTRLTGLAFLLQGMIYHS